MRDGVGVLVAGLGVFVEVAEAEEDRTVGVADGDRVAVVVGAMETTFVAEVRGCVGACKPKLVTVVFA